MLAISFLLAMVIAALVAFAAPGFFAPVQAPAGRGEQDLVEFEAPVRAPWTVATELRLRHRQSAEVIGALLAGSGAVKAATTTRVSGGVSEGVNLTAVGCVEPAVPNHVTVGAFLASDIAEALYLAVGNSWALVASVVAIAWAHVMGLVRTRVSGAVLAPVTGDVATRVKGGGFQGAFEALGRATVTNGGAWSRAVPAPAVAVGSTRRPPPRRALRKGAPPGAPPPDPSKSGSRYTPPPSERPRKRTHRARFRGRSS